MAAVVGETTVKRTTPSLCLVLFAIPFLAGCTAADDDVLRLVFTQADDSLEPTKRPERLAEAIEQSTGRATQIFFVQELELGLHAVAAGQADAAFVDAAAGWYAWKRFGLNAVAAHLESDGRPHYIASAWVRNDTAYQTMEDLRGADSCHTGLLKSAGTFMPLGWMIGNKLVARVGPDDVSSIEPTLDAFFGTPRVPRSDSDPYGNYQGALRCLSEGLGQVAFGKDTTPATFCGPAAPNRPDWCLDITMYRELQQFGRVPSHPVMAGFITPEKRLALVDGLTALSATPEGQAILQSVLGTKGVVAVESAQAYLGEYANNIRNVPGMLAYVERQVEGPERASPHPR